MIKVKKQITFNDTDVSKNLKTNIIYTLTHTSLRFRFNNIIKGNSIWTTYRLHGDNFFVL